MFCSNNIFSELHANQSFNSYSILFNNFVAPFWWAFRKQMSVGRISPKWNLGGKSQYYKALRLEWMPIRVELLIIKYKIFFHSYSNYCGNPGNFGIEKNYSELSKEVYHYGTLNFNNIFESFLVNLNFVVFTGWFDVYSNVILIFSIEINFF